ncbi:hypothetical protein PR048_026657 [Dryococelus australis]|uniref:28S ribosomal protein S27, mitochondrial n=1 Tax=Dryococelus australis TaxID=614101 RepID=A0ABQ9GLY9_9NEOP|nr:hypothetical protein PR048_026657 [Dryococelus australis]
MKVLQHHKEVSHASAGTAKFQNLLPRKINFMMSSILDRRWFLSPAYSCQDVWEKRLESPLLQQVKLDDFHYEVDAKYQSKQQISAIDVDLFANAVQGAEHLDELEDLVYKLRLGPTTADTLPSTPHALVRHFLAAGRTDDLLRILNDRINYGMFPDYYISCLLMDAFLRQKNYTAAAQVGVLQMLQDDWEDDLTTHLALYSCHMHLQQPGHWQPEEVPEPPDDGEEVKVRVKYIRNPYFDDHFDLRDPKLLVGKTLAAVGARVPGAVGQTYQLVGWALYEKWDRVLAMLEQLIAGWEEPLFYQEGLWVLVSTIHCLVDNKIDTKDLHEALESTVHSMALQQEPSKVVEQCRAYEAWEQLRKQRLEEELAAAWREQRSREIQETHKELEQHERTIFFFDNQEQWELQAEEKDQAASATGIQDKKTKDDSEEYIPPEIRRPRV